MDGIEYTTEGEKTLNSMSFLISAHNRLVDRFNQPFNVANDGLFDVCAMKWGTPDWKEMQAIKQREDAGVWENYTPNKMRWFRG